MNIKKMLKSMLRLHKETEYLSLPEARQRFNLGIDYSLDFDTRFIKPVKIPIVY